MSSEYYFEEIRPEELKRFHGTKLKARNVELAPPVQIKGDKERREQMDAMLEQMAEERLRRAAEKARAIEDEAAAAAEKLLSETQAHAEAHAKQLVETALAEENAIREKAYNEGFEAGFNAGHAEATRKVETETVEMLAGAQTLVQGAYETERRVLENFQANALAIVQHVCQSIVKEELQTSPETMLAMIEKAADALYLSGKINVIVGEETIEDIRSFSQVCDQAIIDMSRFEFTADSRLGRHDIYVLGESASYDISADVQVGQLLAPLKNNLPIEEIAPTPVPETLEEIQAGEPLDIQEDASSPSSEDQFGKG